MDAVSALAWTLPPSVAAIVWAAAWLQHQRDRRLNEAAAKLLDKTTEQTTWLLGKFADFEDKHKEQQISIDNAHRHISRLTERLHS